jgi:hypothetical protein
MARPKNAILLDSEGAAYLPGTKAAITIGKPSALLADPDKDPTAFTKDNKEYLGAAWWGEKNDLPNKILEKLSTAPVALAGVGFNISMAYGDGVVYGRYVKDGNKRVFVEADDVQEINDFFERNDIQNYLLEQCNDLTWFYNMFPEVILDKNLSKIATLAHKEAVFSRWEVQNPKTARIEHHFYSAKWGKEAQPDEKDIIVTPVLNPHDVVGDLQERAELQKKAVKPQYRYIIPLNIPTPGRNYYQKPYWYSIIESGWLDYARKIPEFKNALLDNAMVIKYHIELSTDYFETIFKQEGINDAEKKVARMKKEYEDLNKFLSKTDNTGRSVISFIRHDNQGKELRRMKITVIENSKAAGSGQYIEDSEEVSNIILFSMGVHPSLIGAVPGKGKNISGSEARELFIIKQAMMKPLRDRLLRPFYIIKKFNKWPEDIHFRIPNLVLLTLDQGSGSERVIS